MVLWLLQCHSWGHGEVPNMASYGPPTDAVIPLGLTDDAAHFGSYLCMHWYHVNSRSSHWKPFAPLLIIVCANAAASQERQGWQRQHYTKHCIRTQHVRITTGREMQQFSMEQQQNTFIDSCWHKVVITYLFFKLVSFHTEDGKIFIFITLPQKFGKMPPLFR